MSKDKNGTAPVRFSVSENGKLQLSAHNAAAGSATEELDVVVPRAKLLLEVSSGDKKLGVVETETDAPSMDFTIDALQLLPALKIASKKRLGDPAIAFVAPDKVIEFCWPDYNFLIMPLVPTPTVEVG